MKEIILEDFPSSLEWLKKTSPGYNYTGSFSAGKVFSSNALLYRIWCVKVKVDEKDIRELHACCLLKESGFASRPKMIEEEQIFEFSADGLSKVKEYVLSKATENSDFLGIEAQS